jgi:hypothetical protein
MVASGHEASRRVSTVGLLLPRRGPVAFALVLVVWLLVSWGGHVARATSPHLSASSPDPNAEQSRADRSVYFGGDGGPERQRPSTINLAGLFGPGVTMDVSSWSSWGRAIARGRGTQVEPGSPAEPGIGFQLSAIRRCDVAQPGAPPVPGLQYTRIALTTYGGLQDPNPLTYQFGCRRIPANLHKRFLAAANALLRERTAHVHLSAVLGGRLAQSLGVKAGTTFTGTGVVDFARGRARWSFSLPSNLGGALRVVTHGSTAYMKLGLLTSHARRPWIRVRSLRQLRAFGFGGALAILLEPDRAVKLLRATNPVATKVSGHVGAARALPRQPGVIQALRTAANAGCEFKPATTLQDSLASPQHIPKDLSGFAKDLKTSFERLTDARKNIKTLLDAGPNGVAAALQLSYGADLGISEKFFDCDKAVGFEDPPKSQILDAKSWLTLNPCLVGTWGLTGPLTGLAGTPIATGTLILQILPNGFATLTYNEDRTTYSHAPGDYGRNGFYGAATLTALSPAAIQGWAHQLTWAITIDNVLEENPGNFTPATPPTVILEPPTEPGEPPTPPIIIPGTPEINIPPTTSIVAPSGITATSFDCTAASLSLKLPIGNENELSFGRLSPPYLPPTQ